MLEVHYQKSEKSEEEVQQHLDQIFDLLFDEVMKDDDGQWKSQIDDYRQLGISSKYGVSNTQRGSQTTTGQSENG